MQPRLVPGLERGLPGLRLFSGEGADPVSRHLVIKEVSRQKALTAN